MLTTHLYGVQTPNTQKEFHIQDTHPQGGAPMVMSYEVAIEMWGEDEIDTNTGLSLGEFFNDADVNDKFYSSEGAATITRIK